MQRVANHIAVSETGPLQPFSTAARLAVGTRSNAPHREIFGFGLASSLSDASFGYPSWDFSLLSTVAFFGLHVQGDGNFAPDSGWSVWNSGQLSGLLSTAHANGTKVVLTIILQDFGQGTPHMCAGLVRYGATVSQTVSEVIAKGVDGVNVDYEGLNGNCGSTTDPSWARHNFTGFVRTLRSALPAGSYLSVDTYASSAADPLGFFDVPGMAPSVDSFFVMAYDLEYSNYLRAPASCSSFCLGPTAPLAGYYYNDTSTASQYVAAVPASKVILGVPYYGRKACVSTPTPNQYPNPANSVAADSYLDASGEPSAPEVRPGSYTTNRDGNDPTGQERWDTWYNTSLNCTRELYWDDAVSLGNKYDLVATDNLRGIGIWNLNYGGGAPELWNELRLKFGATTPWSSLGGVLNGDAVVSSAGPNRIDVFARGFDNGLWHRWWNGSGWVSWENLGGVMTAAPSAVDMSASHVEAFVRGGDNGLWHRSFDGTSWSGWVSLGGNFNSGPHAVSSGSNLVDVFVRGGDNGLWRKTWNGTAWSWQPLGGVLPSDLGAATSTGSRTDVFARGADNGLWQNSGSGSTWSWAPRSGVLPSDLIAVASTSARVDVFVRGADNALWQASGNGSSWTWSSLGGAISSAPAVASCAPGHLDVFVVGGDSGIWHRGFNGSVWSDWQRLGGLWSGRPAAVCPTGTTTIAIFDADRQGGLWATSVLGS